MEVFCFYVWGAFLFSVGVVIKLLEQQPADFETY